VHANDTGGVIAGTDGNDTVFAGLGYDQFFVGAGANAFVGTPEQVNGDQLANLKPGDRVEIEGFSAPGGGAIRPSP
jgi:Ca2+-binding RTX toxin-like protein